MKKSVTAHLDESSMEVVEQSEWRPLSSSLWDFNCATRDLSWRYTDMHSWDSVGSDMSISDKRDRCSPAAQGIHIHTELVFGVSTGYDVG